MSLCVAVGHLHARHYKAVLETGGSARRGGDDGGGAATLAQGQGRQEGTAEG